MESATYVSASHLSSLADSLDVIAANLANANTAGYKRTVGRFEQALLAAIGQAPGAASGTVVHPALAQFDTRPVDFSPGPIRTTGRPLDLAVKGDAIFVVETAAGPRYTRKGQLHVSADGAITDGSGNAFAAAGGALRLPAGAHDITVAPDGQVTANGEQIGRLRLVDVARPDMLVAQGSTLFRNEGPAPRDAADSEIIQGAIEESNVSPVLEMVALVQVTRAYEASARVMRRMDGLHGQLVKEASA